MRKKRIFSINRCRILQPYIMIVQTLHIAHLIRPTYASGSKYRIITIDRGVATPFPADDRLGAALFRVDDGQAGCSQGFYVVADSPE